jgi:hypothetical protein
MTGMTKSPAEITRGSSHGGGLDYREVLDGEASRSDGPPIGRWSWESRNGVATEAPSAPSFPIRRRSQDIRVAPDRIRQRAARVRPSQHHESLAS